MFFAQFYKILIEHLNLFCIGIAYYIFLEKDVNFAPISVGPYFSTTDLSMHRDSISPF